MSANHCAVLEVVGEGRVALESVAMEGALHELLAEVTITQTYRNVEQVNIEAVYTFPLPLDAVLLEMSVTLGERSLRGVITERSQAEQDYEDAITDGNSAILLQQSGDGLYTMNVGNLQPGETAVIRFRYGQMQRWQGDNLRFHVPTTIAPRYGDPAAAGLAPHQVPVHSLVHDFRFTLRLAIDGHLADAVLDSPSHAVAVTRGDGVAVVEFMQGASLDRDFVLNIHGCELARAGALSQIDGDRHVVLASFNPRFGVTEDDVPRSIKILIDCSGSMGGDSIAQAREALLRIIDALRPQDYFNIVAFGDTHKSLFVRQMPASDINRNLARQRARTIDADMGGTEIGAALAATCALPCEAAIPQDVLLVTDGQAWNADELTGTAQRTGHRVFTVGVGSAVAEALVRDLAESTGGACELVSPREDMAERIHRHFRRMYAPRAQTTTIRWPATPMLSEPSAIGAVYDGDTLQVFGWFTDPPQGDVTLEVMLPDGRQLMQSAPIALLPLQADDSVVAQGVIARMGAARRLRSMEDDVEGARLAVEYQLLSPWSACVVVDVRAEDQRAQTLPELRQVPQMVAAGWGGSGSVVCESFNSSIAYSRKSNSLGKNMSHGYMGIPAFLRRSAEPDIAQNDDARSPGRLVKWLNDHCHQMDDLDVISTIDGLESLGLPRKIVDALRALVDCDADESVLIVALLGMLAGSGAGKSLSREARRVIDKAVKTISPPQEVFEVLRQHIGFGFMGGWRVLS